MLTANDLMAFEAEVADHYNAGEIHGPVHLSGGDEGVLLRVFARVKPIDWVLSTWRNHYHALLKGIPRDEVMRQILAGRSMYINSAEHRFYSSSIVGGTLSIAVGLALAIKCRNGPECVWAFVGDMTSLTGAFDECARYAWNFKLPLVFIIADNGLSVATETRVVWGQAIRDVWLPNCVHYCYKLTWPHIGTGKWVAF